MGERGGRVISEGRGKGERGGRFISEGRGNGGERKEGHFGAVRISEYSFERITSRAFLNIGSLWL